MTLGCSLMIGTDAGSSLVMGAYGFPQITLLSDWMEGHTSNFEALAPMNKNNISIFHQFEFFQSISCSLILHLLHQNLI